ncbi:MAG TPA: hypothetical protein VMG10_02720 [Gemmataceae bacterium]|nr:hypothetical protein [Gemmataceae bacterium]
MNASTDVPVTITPEAEAYIVAIGKQMTLEKIIAYLRGMPPALSGIRVELEPAYDSDEPTILIKAVEKPGPSEPETRRREWWDWATTVFPLEEMMDIAVLFTTLEEVS